MSSPFAERLTEDERVSLEKLAHELEENMTRATTMTVEELDRTRAERFGQPKELAAERYPGIELEPVREACGGKLEQNPAGFFDHIDIDDAMKCGIPTVAMRERTAR